ncbi:hypothetical protein [Pseudomonas lundensis]|uniref:hypothetical protein n=1 Tax=Pseudomonas lundensis TaxID=86185 RepID=UPI0014740423|nr:hypothetical protein [Pseudomonas lundensis]NMZ97449.1 hypothetical protein [Pseudomonas lundensis]
MPEYSHLYIELKERLAKLESTFLGAQIAAELEEPLTFAADLDQIAAFRVLVHAEIEDYLERKAKESIIVLRDRAKLDGFSIKSNIELFLLANVFGCELPVPTPYDVKAIVASVGKLLADVERFVTGNNGIKEGSFIKLSLICGRMADELDVNLINMLNSYGRGRGDVAHQSTLRVRSLHAPTAEKANAIALVRALGDFFYSE